MLVQETAFDIWKYSSSVQRYINASVIPYSEHDTAKVTLNPTFVQQMHRSNGEHTTQFHAEEIQPPCLPQ